MPEKKDCSFFLKEPKAATPTWINFHMTCPDGTVKRSILQKILPADWDTADQRPAGGGRQDREIGQVIDAIVAMIPGLKSECRRNNRVICCADVHAALDVILQDRRSIKKKEPAKSMITDCEKIIAGMKDGSITTPKKKKRYSEATIRNYEKVVLAKIEKYYKEKKKPAVWNTITLELYNDFISWCHSGNLSNNSIGNYIRHWKVLGKTSLNKGWHSNQIFKDESFVALREETPAIYLDDSKIDILYKHKFINADEAIARDWAVLDCYLGLRISDLRKVTANDFKGDFFQFVNQKTGAHVVIPIHRYAKEILKKWDGLPPAVKEHKFRPNIKAAAKSADLNQKFIYVATIGGTVQQFEYKEWECCTPHTFRRSFITNLLKMGIPTPQVMKLAGIKRYETLMRYFKQTPTDVAKEVGDHPFFQ